MNEPLSVQEWLRRTSGATARTRTGAPTPEPTRQHTDADTQANTATRDEHATFPCGWITGYDVDLTSVAGASLPAGLHATMSPRVASLAASAALSEILIKLDTDPSYTRVAAGAYNTTGLPVLCVPVTLSGAEPVELAAVFLPDDHRTYTFTEWIDAATALAWVHAANQPDPWSADPHLSDNNRVADTSTH